MAPRMLGICAAAALALVPRAALLGFRAPAMARSLRAALPASRARPSVSRWRMLSGGGAAESARPVALAARLAKLRALMAEEQLDALIVPSDDPHLSEYPPACFNRREFVSGFTGSAGTVVVTATKALCW